MGDMFCEEGRHRLGIMAGTSPSVTIHGFTGWQAAYQANTGHLWVIGRAM